MIFSAFMLAAEATARVDITNIATNTIPIPVNILAFIFIITNTEKGMF